MRVVRGVEWLPCRNGGCRGDILRSGAIGALAGEYLGILTGPQHRVERRRIAFRDRIDR